VSTSRKIRGEIVAVGKRMLDRWLTDLAGGNISVRSDNTIYITPRYAGTKWGWQLKARDIISGRLGDPVFEENTRISREAPIHLAIYRAFPTARAVIHAHPYHLMPFCASELSIPPVIEKADLFGDVPLARNADANSSELANNVVDALVPQQQFIGSNAAAVLLPKHGVVVAGKNLETALYALSKLDLNAWCVLAELGKGK